MKVVVVGTRGFPGVQGGVETHCEQLYPRLVARGCEVIVFSRKPYVNQDARVYRGVHLVPLSCPRQKHLEALWHSLYAVWRARRLSPDLLHIHALGPSLVAPMARALGMRVVVTNHGPEYERLKWGRLAKAVLKLGERLGSCWAHAMICISEPIAQAIRCAYGIHPIVIPNGVTVPERVESQGALRRYGLTPGRYLVAVGRFVPEKGFHDLLEAFRRLQASGALVDGQPSWKLVLVGRADHEDRYSRHLVQQASGILGVVLTGFLSGAPLAELYSHAGLFVLPSTYEGLPITLLEAMSYGLPCLASDIPAHRSVGLPEERYVPPGDVEALAKKLRELIDRPLGDAQRRDQIRRIAEGFNWERIAERTLNVYQTVCNSADGRAKAARTSWTLGERPEPLEAPPASDAPVYVPS